MTKSKIKKTGNFLTCFVIKYPVFIFDSMDFKVSDLFWKISDKFSWFFLTLWQISDRKPSYRTGQPLTSKNQPPAGSHLFTVILFCFSYWSKRKLSIDFISSIYKFFSSSLIKLFFFFKSFFFFKVSFVFVFSKIDWKRSNVSSSIIYNWL